MPSTLLPPIGLGGASYASSSSSSALRPRAAAPPPPPHSLSVRATLEGGPTRILHLPLSSGYPELLICVMDAFPDAGPLRLTYVDAEGDALTISSRADLKMALHGAVQRTVREMEEAARAAAAGGAPRPPSSPPGSLPPIFLTAIRVAASPAPPRDESGADPVPEAGDDIVEIDEWMLSLSELFRSQLGLEPGQAVDINALGVERCCTALEEAIATPAASGLLDAAAAKFQEAAASALFNRGNAYISAARKRLDAVVTAAVNASKAKFGAAQPGATSMPLSLVEAAIEGASGAAADAFGAALATAGEQARATSHTRFRGFFFLSLAAPLF